LDGRRSIMLRLMMSGRTHNPSIYFRGPDCMHNFVPATPRNNDSDDYFGHRSSVGVAEQSVLIDTVAQVLVSREISLFESRAKSGRSTRAPFSFHETSAVR
jgi:hypothetical protein